MSRPRALRALFVAALVLLPFAAMLPQLDRGLDGDEGVYATMARLLLDGGVPYRDLFDNKPPLQYAWFSVGLLAFGDDVQALRLTTALVMSATTIPVYLAGRMLFPPRGGYVALGAFVASQLIVPDLTNGLPETLMLLPLVSGFVVLLAGLRSGRGRWFLLAGLLFGLAVLTKPVAIWPAAAFVPGTALLMRNAPVEGGIASVHSWRRGLTAALWYAGGGAIALLTVLSPFLLWNALPDLFDALVTFNLELSSEFSYAERAENLGASLLDVLGRPALTAVLSCGLLGLSTAVVTARRMRREHVAFLILSATATLGMASTGYFFVHHYVQLFPVLALGCAAGVAAAPAISSTPRGRLALVAGLGMVVALPTALAFTASASHPMPQPNEDPAYATVPPERRESLTDDQFHAAWSARNVGLGAYLRAHTNEEDRIHVHGGGTSRSPLYFHAERKPAVRYFFDSPLRLRPEEIGTTVEELWGIQPLFIVDAFSADYRYTLNADIDTHPEAFLALLDEHYEYIGTMHFADVYRRIDP